MSEPVTPMDELSNTEYPRPAALPRPSQHELAELPVAELPVAEQQGRQYPRVSAAAETVGTIVGRTVERVRELPHRIQGLRERFTVISGRTREDAATAAAEWKETAKQKAYETRNRAQHLAHEYPLQTILGTAAVAFVLGFALRIWRSNRA